MNCRVLLVEDHDELARITGTMIELCGCDLVGPAKSVAEAERLIAEGQLDVALIDQGLPDGSGTDVIRTLMKRGIPCGVLSGYHRDDVLDRGLERIPWVLKPLEQDQLERVLAELRAAAGLSTGSEPADTPGGAASRGTPDD